MTNILIGIFIGIIFAIAAMIVIGIWMDRDTANHIKEDLGEDFEFMAIPKSQIEKIREYLEKENNTYYEVRTKTHI